MATSIRLIRRYVWLVDTIRSAGHLTLQQINERWANNVSLNTDGEDRIPERTFHRHREAIADMFGIDIECSRELGNAYHIADPESLERSSFKSWLFKGLSIDNLMLDNKSVKGRVIFEPTSGGTGFIPDIVRAMTENRKLYIGYQTYYRTKGVDRTVAPYFLKQSRQRWYLIGCPDGSANLIVYSLDRIPSLELSDETFDMDNALASRSDFSEVIGINLDSDYEPEEIVVRVYGDQRKYIESLPLHQSQTRIARTGDYSDYRYRLRAEWEFQHEILRMGPDAEVISPRWLRDDMAWYAGEMVKRYPED